MGDSITDQRLRILFVSQQYPCETGSEGIGTYVKVTAQALCKGGHEVHVLSTGMFNNTRHYVEGGVHIHRIKQIHIKGLYQFTRLLHMTRTIERLLNAFSNYFGYRKLKICFDVIEYPDWHAEGLIFSFLKPAPLVAHLHTHLPLIVRHNKEKETIDTRLAEFLEKLAISRADIITSASSSLAKETSKCFGIDTERIVIIPNSIEPIPQKEWTDGLKKTKTHWVLFTGRLETLKNPQIVIDAAPIVLKEIRNVEFIFIGKDGDCAPSLRELSETLKVSNNIKFEGAKSYEQTWRYRQKSEICVVPSRYENFPFAVLEAMAAGKPVIASSVGGIKEIIRDNETGKLVRPDDVQGWANAMLELLKNPDVSLKIGQRARDEAQSRFSPTQVAKKRETIYFQAIKSYQKRRKPPLGVLTAGLSLKKPMFPWAVPKEINGVRIPQKWKEFITDVIIQEPWYHFYLRAAHQLLELIDEPVLSKKILDAGCTPAISVLLALLGAEVTILDISNEELRKAVAFAQKLGIRNKIHLVRADIFRMPFSRVFDITWNSGVIEHFEDPVKVIRCMSSTVHEGGKVGILVPNKWTLHTWLIRPILRSKGEFYWDYMGREKSYSQNRLSYLMKKAGLKVTKTSIANLRRSILDDCLIDKLKLNRPKSKRTLFYLINIVDWLEHAFPASYLFGFMVGAVGMVSEPMARDYSSS